MKTILAGCGMSAATVLGFLLLDSQLIPGAILFALGLGAFCILSSFLLPSPQALLLQLFPFLIPLRYDTLVVAWAVAFAILGLVTPSQGNRTRVPRATWMAILALAVAGLLAWTRSFVPDEALIRYVGTMAGPFLVFLTILRLPKGDPVLEQLPRLVYLTFALIGVLSLVFKLQNPHISRVAGYFPLSVTMVGYAAAAMVPLGLHYVYERPNKLVEGLLFTLVVMAMLLTNTRMAMIMTSIGLVTNFRRMKQTLGLALPVVLLILVLGPSILFSRFQELERAAFDVSSASRLLAWYEGLQMVLAHPWLGIGFDNFAQAFIQSTPLVLLRLIHSHNMALQLAIDLGLPAMALYLWTVAVSVLRGWKRRGPLAKALGWSVGIYLASGATDAIQYFPGWTMLLWVLLGCLVRLTPPAQATETREQVPGMSSAHGGPRAPALAP
jgi:O-antigen ligase